MSPPVRGGTARGLLGRRPPSWPRSGSTSVRCEPYRPRAERRSSGAVDDASVSAGASPDAAAAWPLLQSELIPPLPEGAAQGYPYRGLTPTEPAGTPALGCHEREGGGGDRASH